MLTLKAQQRGSLVLAQNLAKTTPTAHRSNTQPRPPIFHDIGRCAQDFPNLRIAAVLPLQPLQLTSSHGRFQRGMLDGRDTPLHSQLMNPLTSNAKRLPDDLVGDIAPL